MANYYQPRSYGELSVLARQGRGLGEYGEDEWFGVDEQAGADLNSGSSSSSSGGTDWAKILGTAIGGVTDAAKTIVPAVVAHESASDILKRLTGQQKTPAAGTTSAPSAIGVGTVVVVGAVGLGILFLILKKKGRR